MISKALRELQRRCGAEGWSASELGRRLGVLQPTASRLIRGVRGPSLELANAIELELGIPAQWWGENAEEPAAAGTFPDDGTPAAGGSNAA